MITDKQNIPFIYEKQLKSTEQRLASRIPLFAVYELQTQSHIAFISKSTMIRNIGSEEYSFFSQRILDLIRNIRTTFFDTLALYNACVCVIVCELWQIQRICFRHEWPSPRHLILFIFVFVSVRRPFRPFALFAGTSLANQCCAEMKRVFTYSVLIQSISIFDFAHF